MAEITLEMLNSVREPIKHINIDGVVHRRVESGFEFDARKHMPFFDTAILLFRVVCPYVFHQRQQHFEQNIPVHTLEKLNALENQVYRGPNRIPRPNCVNPLFSALGIGSEEMSQTAWQHWANLGTMSMKSAAAKYLYELSKYHPGILDESFESDGRTFSIQTGVRMLAAYILQRNFRHRKAYRPIQIVARKIMAFEKIQRFFIHMKKRKRLIEARLFAQEKNYKKLIEMLLRGIPINSLINGKMVPEYLGIFKIGEPDLPNRRTGKYVLYTSSKEKVKAAVDMKNGMLLSDVAEIRSGCANFPKSKNDGYPNADLCFSIIGSQKTFYAQFVQNLEVQLKPAPLTAAKPKPGAKEISKPNIWDGLDPFGGKSMGWIMRVFPSLIESTLSQQEASSRGRFKGYTPAMKKQSQFLEFPSIKADAELCSALLVKGLRVDVWKCGKSSFEGTQKEAQWESKIVYINWSRRRINVGDMPKFGILGDPITNKGFFVEDMAEIRRGRVLPEWDERFHFERPYQSDVNKTRVMTIVAGENSFTIKLESCKVRNRFVNMFRAFMEHFKHNYTPLSSAALTTQVAKTEKGKIDNEKKPRVPVVNTNPSPSDIGNTLISSTHGSQKSNRSFVGSIKSVASSFGMLGIPKSSQGKIVGQSVSEGGSVQSRVTKSSDRDSTKTKSTFKSLRKMAKQMILGPKRDNNGIGNKIGGSVGIQKGTESELESKYETNVSTSEQAIVSSNRSDSSSIYSNISGNGKN